MYATIRARPAKGTTSLRLDFLGQLSFDAERDLKQKYDPADLPQPVYKYEDGWRHRTLITQDEWINFTRLRYQKAERWDPFTVRSSDKRYLEAPPSGDDFAFNYPVSLGSIEDNPATWFKFLFEHGVELGIGDD